MLVHLLRARHPRSFKKVGIFSMVKVLLLEDEEYNREFLKKILSDLSGIDLIFDTSKGEEAVAWTKKNHPDIALLDIELSGQELNGLNVAQRIRRYNKDAYIVFITGYSQYALESFDVHPYGYVLKPIKIARLQELMEEIIQRLKRPDEAMSGIITARLNDEIVHINHKDIIFIEVENHRSIIHTQRAMMEIRKSLDDLEAILGSDFLRVHRSFIVNLTKIKKVRETYDRSYEIEFWDYQRLALMSRYHYPGYKKRF